MKINKIVWMMIMAFYIRIQNDVPQALIHRTL